MSRFRKNRASKVARIYKTLGIAALTGLSVIGVQTNAQTVAESNRISDGAMTGAAADLLPDLGNNDISTLPEGPKFTINGEGKSLNGAGLQGFVVGDGQTLIINNINGENATGDAQGKGVYGYSKTESVSNPSRTSSSNPYLFEGGAVLKVLQNATADFTGTNVISNNNYTNTMTSSTTGKKYSATYGGLISNEGVITNLNTSFNNNTININAVRTNGSVYSYLYGGILGNRSAVGDISGEFAGNTVTTTAAANAYTYFYGGLVGNRTDATHLNVSLGNILGGIKDNVVNTGGVSTIGGLLYNYTNSANSTAIIGDITGGLKDNTVTSNSSSNSGGLLYNETHGANSSAIVGDITGGIKGNNVTVNSNTSYGGLLYNSASSNDSIATIGSIKGGITGNTINAQTISGGLLYNYSVSSNSSASFGDINGGISDNTITAQSIYGGVVYNSSSGASSSTATIGDITDSIQNNTMIAHDRVLGGLLYNYAYSLTSTKIGAITASIKDNTITAQSDIFGGLMHNYVASAGSIEIGAIAGSFEGNRISSTGNSNAYIDGGLLYNSVSSSNSILKVNNISGGMKNNTVSSLDYIEGGLLKSSVYSSAKAEIGDISGGISGNTITSQSYIFGGFLYNYSSNNSTSTVGSIADGIFNNEITATAQIAGGLFRNEAKSSGRAEIGAITGGILNNRTAADSINGGLLNNLADASSAAAVGDISDGILNNIITARSNINGGLLYNYAAGTDSNATVGAITGGITGNTISAATNLTGGLIYNYKASDATAATVTLTDLSIKDNILTAGSMSTVQGGLINNSGTLNINAVSTDVEISGNTLNNEMSKADIFNTGVINLNAAEGKTLTIEQIFNGTDGTVNVDKDSTTKGGTYILSSVNSGMDDQKLGTLNLGKELNFIGDFDVNARKADTITAQSSTDGVIVLKDLNVYSGSMNDFLASGDKVQILKTPNDTLQLALGEELQQYTTEILVKTEVTQAATTTVDEIQMHTPWDHIYKKHSTDASYQNTYGKLALGQTDTTNDSIASITRVENLQGETVDTPLGDTLVLVNQASLDGRTFDFDTSGDVYTVTQDLGTTGEGKFTINGVTGEDGSKSTIDFDGHSGMSITNASDVTIKDVVIENSNNSNKDGGFIYLNNEEAKLSVNDTVFRNCNKKTTSNIDGGVISNINGTINEISADFIDNYISSSSKAEGSVIANDGNIETINAKFIRNNAESTANEVIGGVISNVGNISSISGSFEDNHATSNWNRKNYYAVRGGAIFNFGTIGNIYADFSNNSATEKGNSIASGGAIYNSGASVSIGNIIGNFTGNATIGGGIGNVRSSAIENKETASINNIIGNFLYNSSYSRSTGDTSGAILNWNSTINSIEGYFEGNSAESQGRASAGALNNNTNSVITEGVSADFVRNYAKSTGTSALARAGAILNFGYIPHITGDFTQNYAESSGTGAIGGAIAVMHSTSNTLEKDGVDQLEGNYTGNYALATGANGYAYGGAIYNTGTLGEIVNSNFENNYAKAVNGDVHGGAIYNDATITSIHADFKNNTAFSEKAIVRGGALYNGENGNINSVLGNFINNSTKTTLGKRTLGGAIYNAGNINTINGLFKGNNAINENTLQYSYGGAIYNEGGINTIEADFSNNYVISNSNRSPYMEALGGAIKNAGNINKIKGNFKGNYTISTNTGSCGGAILNNSIDNNPVIETIIGNFENNYSISENSYATGGAIYNSSIIGNLNGNFASNSAQAFGTYAAGGAVYNTNTIDNITGDFTKNYASAKTYSFGGALFNIGTIGDIQGSFKNNYAKTSSEDNLALGGAVYSNRADMQFTADGKQSAFSGNYTQDKRGKINNAIFVRTNKAATATAEETFYEPTITLNAKNGGSFLFNDNIDGGELDSEVTELKRNHQYNLKLKGDTSGKVYFNNDILNANIEHNDVTTYVNGMKYLNHAQTEGINSLTMNSGTLNVGSFNLSPLHFDTFGMNGGTINIDKVDVDLANKVMGRITANSYTGTDKGTINVKSMNVLSDGEKDVTPVLFADKSFKNTVKSPVKEAYTKLYRYDVSYDSKGTYGQDGYFVFTRGGNGGNPSDGFNPAVLSDSTSVQAGGQSTMNNVFLYAFEHADVFSQLPSVDRFAKINSNRYALASTDFNSNLKYNGDLNNQGIWVKPFSTFENIKLKNGPKINTISYGTLIGFDSDFHKLKHGWANVATAYIGYTGAQMDYNSVDSSLNTGLAGVTETFYKGNFWTALTATAGAGVAEANTSYGKDDITMLMAGIGSKTGYNIEFNEGKFIIQPRLFISYTFINSFDYTNAAGVRIDSDPMHTVQINPSLRFIGNTKNGWQPYASVGMMWNLLNETHSTANGVKLPEMHTRPYVEYGLGLQRTWDDKFSAYGQAMVRNGGKNGVSLTLGFRWALGKAKSEKVNKPNTHLKRVQKPSKKQVVKQPLPQSKQVSSAISTQKKVIKQLSITQKQHLEHTTRTTMNGIIDKF